MPGSLVYDFIPNDDEPTVVIGDYTLTLVETTNVSGNVADLISDLKVMVDFTQKSLTIYKESK